MSRDGSRSALAASRPGAPLVAPSARSTGGNGSSEAEPGNHVGAAQPSRSERKMSPVCSRKLPAARSAKKKRSVWPTVGNAISSQGISLFVEELHFETFLAGVDVDVEQPREVEQMHLMHVRHVQQREEALHLDARAGFFQRFARRRLRSSSRPFP